jgi:hypothetical protein
MISLTYYYGIKKGFTIKQTEMHDFFPRICNFLKVEFDYREQIIMGKGSNYNSL